MKFTVQVKRPLSCLTACFGVEECFTPAHLVKATSINSFALKFSAFFQDNESF